MTSSPIALVCCVAVPVLLVLAYVGWEKATRRNLPHWRNGIALASMVIISTDWVFQTVLWVIYSLHHESPRLSNAVWVQVHLDIYYGVVALPFAFFLKGAPRFLLIAAWFLLQIFKGHFFIA
jgi:hypothetical protein